MWYIVYVDNSGHGYREIIDKSGKPNKYGKMTAYEFYKGRIESCPSYGLKAGHEILELVLRCAGADSSLTADEYNSIIKQADLCHIKMMEENYNEGWS